jgi:hypothetical protein
MESGPNQPEQQQPGSEQQPGQQPESVSPGLVELIGRALTDERFRESLLNDEENAVRGYALTDADREALSKSKESLEEQAQGFIDSTATVAKIVVKGTF